MATKFLEVVAAGEGWTQVRGDDGKLYKLEGTRAWRNNNPGNVEYGKFAKAQGAIGSDGRFAVFPTYEQGRNAKATLMFQSPSYRDKSIEAAISRYAPSSENNTPAYIARVANAAGVPSSTKVSDLSEPQRLAVIAAMEGVEGYRPGTVNGTRVELPAMSLQPSAPNPASAFQRITARNREAINNQTAPSAPARLPAPTATPRTVQTLLDMGVLPGRVGETYTIPDVTRPTGIPQGMTGPYARGGLTAPSLTPADLNPASFAAGEQRFASFDTSRPYPYPASRGAVPQVVNARAASAVPPMPRPDTRPRVANVDTSQPSTVGAPPTTVSRPTLRVTEDGTMTPRTPALAPGESRMPIARPLSNPLKEPDPRPITVSGTDERERLARVNVNDVIGDEAKTLPPVASPVEMVRVLGGPNEVGNKRTDRAPSADIALAIPPMPARMDMTAPIPSPKPAFRQNQPARGVQTAAPLPMPPMPAFMPLPPVYQAAQGRAPYPAPKPPFRQERWLGLPQMPGRVGMAQTLLGAAFNPGGPERWGINNSMHQMFNPGVQSTQQMRDYARATGDHSQLQRGDRRYNAETNDWEVI